MKPRIIAHLSALLLAGATCPLAFAAPALKVADPAPALAPGKWVQGDAVKEFDREHAYVVEFWATWCGPCKAAIPHVNELHEKFKDKGLVVIGQNVWETDAAKVEPFVKSMAGKLSYRIALDDLSGGDKGKMADTWLAAAGLSGIPATFLVGKDGKIAWIGHPMALNAAMIESLLAGKLVAKPTAATGGDKTPAMPAAAEETRAFYEALVARDWAKAEEALATVEKALPAGQTSRLVIMRMQLLVGRGDQAAAAALAEKATAAAPNDVMLANTLSSGLLRAPKPEAVALDAAEKIATRANERLNGNNVSSLITLARVAFLRGDQAKAIELQTKAVELSKPAAQPRMKEFLESYKAGKLPDPAARPAGRDRTEGKPAAAERPVTLKPGDPAPPLATGKWLQGDAVTTFDRYHVYLIECWATWCGPCKAAIPHVNGLHEKFKNQGLVVIGQNVWETDEAKVAPFVQSMAGKLNYRIALDDLSGVGKGKMAETWLAAAGRSGIPCTFLVGKNGTLLWVGHPMSLKEADIEAALAGKFEIKKPER